MNKRINTSLGNLLVATSIVLGATAFSSVHGQGKGGGTVAPREPISSDPMRNSHERTIGEGERARRDPNAVMREVNEDLQRLRAINADLTGVVSANATPDYKRVAETTAEVKKRAARLKGNLASLPASGKDEKRRDLADPAKSPFNESLSMLNNLLGAFVHNPIFSDAGAVDQQLAAKARRDLEDVIMLSDKVRKSAEKLQKNADKSK